MMDDGMDDADEEILLIVEESLDILPPYAAVLTVRALGELELRSATLRHLPTVNDERLARLVAWAELKVQQFCERGTDGTWDWDVPGDDGDMTFTLHVAEADI